MGYPIIKLQSKIETFIMKIEDFCKGIKRMTRRDSFGGTF